MKTLNFFLKNTSLVRMANHHKRCSCSIQAQKVNTEAKVDPIGQEEQMVETVVWASNNNNVDQFTVISEAVTIDAVHPTEMEIIQEDIKRHRKSTSSKSNVNFQVLDAHLSSFLISCNLTFDLIDSSHFKKFVAGLNPNYIIPSSSQLKSRVISQLHVESPERPAKKRRYYESVSESE